MVYGMKKRVNKFARRRIFLLFTISALLITYVIYNSFSYWQKIYHNIKTKRELEKKYDSLLKEKEVLETDVVKLQDPDYVAKYAREKYLYTKDGELVIKIIDENE